MKAFFTLALCALPFLTTVVADTPTSDSQHTFQNKAIYASAQEAFQDLLNALPEESLHAALSDLKGWKDGIFESHHRGVERVHDSNPALATKLIVAAVHDLKKRQAAPSNSTVVPPPPQSSSPPPPQSSNPPSVQPSGQVPPASTPTSAKLSSSPVPPPVSSADRPAIIPVEVTTTENGRTVVQTTAILSEVTASVAVTVERTNAQGQTITTTENRPAIIMTTTDSVGRTVVQTSAAMLLPTSGQVLTTTDGNGSTFFTTYTPDGSKISSIKLITTTGADGKPSTITSYAYVDPAQQTGGAGPSSTARPGLQNGAVKQSAALELAMAGLGALAFFL